MNARAFFCVCVSAFLLATRPGLAEVFHEDFNGDAIDLQKWDLLLGGGTVVVADGRATLSAPCTNPPAGFPYLTSKGNPFPPSGDFVLRVGFRYVEVGGAGTGFGFEYNGCGFSVWQDLCCGPLRVWIGDDKVLPANLPYPDVGYHVYEWTVVGETWTLRIDGVPIGSDVSSCRPTQIFFGHPPFTTCGWTTQEVDFVHIEPTAPTVATRSRWGGLKVLYR